MLIRECMSKWDSRYMDVANYVNILRMWYV